MPSRLSAQVPDTPGAGLSAAATQRIIISLKERRLSLLENGREVRSYPVAIGRPGVAIPLGDTTVVRKRRNPTWHPTANQRRAKPSLPLEVPPGPANPLGRHALDLGWNAIAIHGTNEPGSIGRRVSSGCFRMLPADVEALFAVVEVGTPVRVVAGEAPGPAPGPAIVPTVVAKRAEPPPAPRPAVAALPVSLPMAPAPTPAPSPVPSLVVPDPRCATVTAPLRRMICATPELAALDGRARGLQERFLSGLPPERREAASYALVQDDRRFDDRVTALCWVRKGTEDDPAVAAAARNCLRNALDGRVEDVTRRVAELGRLLPP
ncbi:L,D-transpeptidase [Azospirillum canadense]|uniref:L,D-transpeptidase n=1 Tax=Azospirillum canadense TaxID=403962 RepID=UPI002226D607|nr:L,D-transpeptidase [Azospirillum canadense]MCW2242833.1 L,D-transpeptidase ErfK/SrfK [Azospirillum canadense]